MVVPRSFFFSEVHRLHPPQLSCRSCRAGHCVLRVRSYPSVPRHLSEPMGKKNQAKRASGSGASGGGGGGGPVSIAAAAAAVGVAVVAWADPLGFFREPAPTGTVPICEFGSTEIPTVDALFQRATACIVRGLQPENHTELVNEWSPAKLRRAAPDGEMKLRVTDGPHYTRQLTHSNMDAKTSNFNDPRLKMNWPQGAYDEWDFKGARVKELLRPKKANWGASFTSDVEPLKQALPATGRIVKSLHPPSRPSSIRSSRVTVRPPAQVLPAGVAAAEAMTAAVCPYDCHESLKKHVLISVRINRCCLLHYSSDRSVDMAT